jgi:DNA-binding NarL/FixJ family response regulator
MKARPASSSREKKPAMALVDKSPAAARRKIMLVDDHPMMRAGLAQIINKQPDIQTCCECGSAPEAFEVFHKFNPHLVLTDITLPGKNGIELIKDLLAVAPKLPILVISMHDETMYAERVLRAGARGYIMKESGGENLLIAIRQVLNGQVYVSPRISAMILDNLSARKPRSSSSPIEKLSDREFEIFQLIGQGKSTRDIATQLHLSLKTVEVHRGHIRGKLELKDAMALVHQAIRWFEVEGNRANTST